jgi:AraC-like DNA-binding protein
MGPGMRRLVISTDDVPEAERVSYWRDTVGSLLGISAERNTERDAPLSARFVFSISHSLACLRFRSDQYPVSRGPREIARRSWEDYVLVLREFSIGTWYDFNGREAVVSPGDLVVVDPTCPFVGMAQANWSHEAWLFPRRLLEPRVPVSQLARARVLTGSGGVAAIAKAYLDAFAGRIDALDQREADFVADNFCRLLAVACGAAAGEHQGAVRLARLEEAKRYVALHLADPDLTPEKAAAALKISVRQLHLLFEPSGTSFSQYVLKRRLEECRAALLNPVGGRSITDIALGFGFNSLGTFNRTFRRAFGITPSEVRGGAAHGAARALIE